MHTNIIRPQDIDNRTEHQRHYSLKGLVHYRDARGQHINVKIVQLINIRLKTKQRFFYHQTISSGY